MELKYKGWPQVSIKKYYELEEISTESISEGEEKDMEIIACLCECSPEDISRIPYSEFLSLRSQVRWLGSFRFDTRTDLDKIEIGDRKYRVVKDFSKLSTAQYLDFQNFYNKNDLKTYYGNILATFVIPWEAKEYNTGYDAVEEAKYIYENLDICRANQLMFFFRKRWHNSMIVTMNYLKYLAKRNLKKKNLKDEEREMWKQIEEQTQDMPGFQSLI